MSSNNDETHHQYGRERSNNNNTDDEDKEEKEERGGMTRREEEERPNSSDLTAQDSTDSLLASGLGICSVTSGMYEGISDDFGSDLPDVVSLRSVMVQSMPDDTCDPGRILGCTGTEGLTFRDGTTRSLMVDSTPSYSHFAAASASNNAFVPGALNPDLKHGGFPSVVLDKAVSNGQLTIPPLPAYFLLEGTNFAVNAITAEQLNDFKSNMTDVMLLCKLDEVKFKPTNFKWTITYFKGSVFLDMRLRCFMRDSCTIVEMQRRDGDAAVFYSLYRRLVTTFRQNIVYGTVGTYQYVRDESAAAALPPPPPPRTGGGPRLFSVKKKLVRQMLPDVVAGDEEDGSGDGDAPMFATTPFNHSSSSSSRPPLPSWTDDDDDDDDGAKAASVKADIECIFRMVKSQYLDTQAEALRTLASLSEQEDFRARLAGCVADVNAMSELARTLKVEFAPVRRFASVVLANLSQSSGSSAAVQPSSSSSSLSSKGGGGDGVMKQLMLESHLGIVDELTRLVLEEQVEIGARRECGRCLVNLASEKTYANEMVQKFSKSVNDIASVPADVVCDADLRAKLEKFQQLIVV